jgi:hypothetical protein
MLTIRSNQLEQIDNLVELNFLKNLKNRLSKDLELNTDLRYDFEQLSKLVSIAKGAGIVQDDNVFEYCKFTLANQVLLSKPLPVWAKNILYSDLDSNQKIRALKNCYLEMEAAL